MNNALRSVSFFVLFAAAGLAQAADDAKAIVDGYMAAWNAHDVEKAGTFLAADAEYLDITVGTPQKGREAARDNVIKVFVTAVPDLSWKMTGAPIVSKDGIAFEWVFSGTNTMSSWSLPKAPWPLAASRPTISQDICLTRSRSPSRTAPRRIENSGLM